MLNFDSFIQIMANDRSYCMIPPETSAQDVINVLHEALLKNAEPPMSMTQEQKNTWVLNELLSKYSRQYNKKLLRERKKRINPDEGY